MRPKRTGIPGLALALLLHAPVGWHALRQDVGGEAQLHGGATPQQLRQQLAVAGGAHRVAQPLRREGQHGAHLHAQRVSARAAQKNKKQEGRASSALSTSPQCSVSGSPAARAAASAGCHVAKAPSVGLPDRSMPTTPRPRSSTASATVSSAAAQSAHRSTGIRCARLRCAPRAAAARAFTAVD